MIKWFFTGVAALNLTSSAYVLTFHPRIYEWNWALTDVALVALAAWAWFAERKYA